MAIHYVNITQDDFLKNYRQVYRFTNLERFIEALKTNKLTFINPDKWTDPYEKFFLERDFVINNSIFKLPAKDNIFAICFSGTISSEAYWKAYTPKEDGVRLIFHTKKLLTSFLEKIPDVEIYVGKVDYLATTEFSIIQFDKKKLISEINDNIVGEEQIKLFLKKRNSFIYENEIRIIIVPNKKQRNRLFLKLDTDITQYTTQYTFDPRLGRHHAKVLNEYFSNNHNIKVKHSNLYSDIKRDPINLTDED